jgi:hypothetical protein
MNRKKGFYLISTILIFTFSFTLPSMTVNVTAITSPSSTNIHTSIYEKTLILTKGEVVDSGAVKLNLLFNIGGAKVNLVQSADEETIVKAVVRYSNVRLEPTLTTMILGDKYTANFKSGRIAQYKPRTVHEWNITIGRYDINTNLTINFGGVRADLELGGMPLTSLTLNLGGDQADLNFSSPTTRSITDIMINCGGSDLSIMNIGNTDFNRFIMDSAGSAVHLDFHGVYSNGEHEIIMNLAAISLETILPIEAGEYVEVYSTVSNVRFSGEGWDILVDKPFYKEYVTDDYVTKDIKLNLRIITSTSEVIIDRRH